MKFSNENLRGSQFSRLYLMLDFNNISLKGESFPPLRVNHFHHYYISRQYK